MRSSAAPVRLAGVSRARPMRALRVLADQPSGLADEERYFCRDRAVSRHVKRSFELAIIECRWPMAKQVHELFQILPVAAQIFRGACRPAKFKDGEHGRRRLLLCREDK